MKAIMIADANILKMRVESILKHHGMIFYEFKRMSSIKKYHHSKDIDLYIIDLDSQLNGVEEIRKIRTLDDKPIVAMSKKADVGLLKKIVLAGCNDFIVMPFSDATLHYKIAKLLDSSHKGDYSPSHYVSDEMEFDDLPEVTLKWTDRIAIDVPEIDKEHKSIIDNYEKLYLLMREGKGHKFYSELLRILNEYVHSHFAHEQELHNKLDYPLKDEHEEIHESFKRGVEKIVEDGFDKEVSNRDVIKISLFVKNWWIQHILVEDMKFAKFLENRQSDK